MNRRIRLFSALTLALMAASFATATAAEAAAVHRMTEQPGAVALVSTPVLGPASIVPAKGGGKSKKPATAVPQPDPPADPPASPPAAAEPGPPADSPAPPAVVAPGPPADPSAPPPAAAQPEPPTDPSTPPAVAGPAAEDEQAAPAPAEGPAPVVDEAGPSNSGKSNGKGKGKGNGKSAPPSAAAANAAAAEPSPPDASDANDFGAAGGDDGKPSNSGKGPDDSSRDSTPAAKGRNDMDHDRGNKPRAGPAPADIVPSLARPSSEPRPAGRGKASVEPPGADRREHRPANDAPGKPRREERFLSADALFSLSAWATIDDDISASRPIVRAREDGDVRLTPVGRGTKRHRPADRRSGSFIRGVTRVEDAPGFDRLAVEPPRSFVPGLGVLAAVTLDSVLVEPAAATSATSSSGFLGVANTVEPPAAVSDGFLGVADRAASASAPRASAPSGDFLWGAPAVARPVTPVVASFGGFLRQLIDIGPKTASPVAPLPEGFLGEPAGASETQATPVIASFSGFLAGLFGFSAP